MLKTDIALPELLVRALVVYLVLLVFMRISGKRTVGQFTPFDLLVVMLVSEAAGPSMTGDDHSMPGGLVVCAVLLGLNALVGLLSSRSRVAERILEGEAALLGRDGRIFEATRKKHRIARSEIDQALREADCEEADVRYAFLEADGSISIQKKHRDPPAASSPGDAPPHQGA